jgi:hypothetical protein
MPLGTQILSSPQDEAERLHEQAEAALVSTSRSGTSPAAPRMENAADCLAANTVSNGSTAAFSLTPGRMEVKSLRRRVVEGDCRLLCESGSIIY